MVWTHPFVIIAARHGERESNHHTRWTEAQCNQFAARQLPTWSSLLTNWTHFGLLITKPNWPLVWGKHGSVGGGSNFFSEHWLSKWSRINFFACNLMISTISTRTSDLIKVNVINKSPFSREQLLMALLGKFYGTLKLRASLNPCLLGRTHW